MFRLWNRFFCWGKGRFQTNIEPPGNPEVAMSMLVSVEFADAGTMTGKHSVLVVGGCSDTTAPGDIGISLEEAKTLLSALQWQYVAAQAAEITENAGRREVCGARLQIKDWFGN
jgi:hypothetical protein